MASEPKRCLATKAGGEPCNAIGVLDSGYCFHHDPARRDQMTRYRAAGHRATRKPRRADLLREHVAIVHANLDAISAILDREEQTRELANTGRI